MCPCSLIQVEDIWSTCCELGFIRQGIQ
jgi:hypothetical protein